MRQIASAALVAILGAGLLTACKGDPLSVQSPSRIPATGLQSAANAQLLVNGALGDFECALGSYIVLGGLIGEELDDATQTADRFPYDARTMISSDRRYAVQSCENLGVYSPLQTARVSADNVRQLLEQLNDQTLPNRQRLLATANLVEGYSMALLGEGFCSTTFSTFDANGEVVYGPELQPAQAYAAAEERFTAAIAAAQAAGATDLLNAALVGRARVRLDEGNLAGARADAVQVPANFEYDATASGTSGRRNNRIWAQNNVISQATSVGAPYRNLNDPRVPVTDLGKRSVTGVPLFAQTKYPAVNSPYPIATGEEAQLIVAEADIGADPANTLAIINAFRAAGNQGPYVGAVDAASLKSEIIDQRRRALFLEGQHLGDLIRYNITPTPAAGTAYPAGGTYGSNICLPLPDVERQNNPVLTP
jgi:hypothetical protein